MVKKILPFLVLLIVCCTPQQRLNNLLKHHPELKSDTANVLVKDSFSTPDLSLDSAFKQNIFYNEITKGDTVTIYKDKIVTKIFLQHDTIHVKSFVKGSKEVKIIKVPVNKYTVQSKINWFYIIIAAVLGMAIGFFLILLIKVK